MRCPQFLVVGNLTLRIICCLLFRGTWNVRWKNPKRASARQGVWNVLSFPVISYVDECIEERAPPGRPADFQTFPKSGITGVGQRHFAAQTGLATATLAQGYPTCNRCAQEGGCNAVSGLVLCLVLVLIRVS